jgi:hypothetical protein
MSFRNGRLTPLNVGGQDDEEAEMEISRVEQLEKRLVEQDAWEREATAAFPWRLLDPVRCK